jgi:ribosomal protein L11 methyltransferase
LPRHAGPLETVSVDVPEEAVEVFEAAFASACDTVGLFRDHATGTWRVEGVRAAHAGDGGLESALLLASELSGIEVPVRRDATVPDGWLARSYASFPEQRIGRRFAVRGTHLRSPPASGRITLTLDAGLAFGRFPRREHRYDRATPRSRNRLRRSRSSARLDADRATRRAPSSGIQGAER